MDRIMDRFVGKDATRRRNTMLALVCVVTCVMLFVTFTSTSNVVPPQAPLAQTAPQAQSETASAGKGRQLAPTIPTFKTRSELGGILNELSFTTGVELGVQRGLFAEATLRKWTRCRRYVLVDLWAHQRNYRDAANYGTGKHSQFKAETLRRVAPFRGRTAIEVCQNYTTSCAARYAGQQFDYIYVDARHDYKGVLQDLHAWYPLLRPGGVLAGHDYVTQNDGPHRTGQDWTTNYDGTRDLSGRVVKGAVDDFARLHGLQITVSYREAAWNTWATRKPYAE